MIKESIFRNGGNVNWQSSIDDAKRLFAECNKPDFRFVITAGEKAWGKSTAFEYLSSKITSGVVVEGDIMSVICYALASGIEFEGSEILSDLGKGILFDGFNPWDVSVEGDRSVLFPKLLSEFFGPDWNSKISLCTAFRGVKSDVWLSILPDYGFYSKNIMKRTTAMLNDAGSSDVFKKHIRKYHVPLSWKEFNVEIEKQVEKADKVKHFMFVPNFNKLQFAKALDHVVLAFI